MKISLNWLKQYVNINIPTDELIQLIGARLVEIEEVIDETHKYDNIFVAKVVTCEKIPDTHLSLCQIDLGEPGRAEAGDGVFDGRKISPVKKADLPDSKILSEQSESIFESDAELPFLQTRANLGPKDTPSPASAPRNLIQVVCGAPNVRAGMLAAWIAPGATVPQSFHEDAPFILGTRKLRGYDSSGMLAGADELDFGTDHSGIVELDPQTAKPGDQFADLFDLRDTILEVENKPLTRRPDTFGIIGFAREIAGILGQPFKTPDFLATTHTDFTQNSTEQLKITITDPALCPRYTALILSRKNDSPKPYLTQLQTLISRSGMRPIDPIVDMTNYLMLLTGQPLHAFDYDKLVAVGQTTQKTQTVKAQVKPPATPVIIVRPAKQGEQIELLDGKTITCQNTDILITSSGTPVALAGAMGAKNTVIDENTKKIIVESATFSLFNLRKTQMDHGIFSEAITRFTKGQPAAHTLPVAKEFATLTAKTLKPLAIFDEYPTPTPKTVVQITTQDINNLLGTTYPPDLIQQTLQNVGFSVTVDVAVLTVTVPHWRTDIHIPEDLIEEVGRLLGYDHITPTVPLHATAHKNPEIALKTKLRNTLSSHGANEVLTYSFISEQLVQSAGQTSANSYRITNSISPDLELIRQQLTPSLLEKVHPNQKDGYQNFALFEINQVYLKDQGLNDEKVPKTFQNLALITTADFYMAKKYLMSLGFDFTLKPAKPSRDEAYFEPKRSAAIYLGDTEIGIIGEIKHSVRAALKLPEPTAAFEISLEPLATLPAPKTTPAASDFPSVQRDLTLTVPADTPYQTIHDRLATTLAAQNLLFSITPVAIYQPENSPTRNLTFHLEFSHPEKTLFSAEISDTMEKLEQTKSTGGRR